MVPEEIALPLPGLVLRRWRVADAPGLLAAIERSMPELRRFMPWAREDSTLASVRAFLADAWAPPERQMFGLFERGEVVGAFGLHGRGRPGILEIGYWVRSDRARQGYATAGSRALTGVSFECFPGVFRVEIRCDPANGASAAVAGKLGFQLTGQVAVEALAAAQTGVLQVWATHRSAWAA